MKQQTICVLCGKSYYYRLFPLTKKPACKNRPAEKHYREEKSLVFLEQQLLGEALVLQDLAKLLQRIHLNLSNTLAGDSEFTSYIFKGRTFMVV